VIIPPSDEEFGMDEEEDIALLLPLHKSKRQKHDLQKYLVKD
jgi:hypothetical protein